MKAKKSIRIVSAVLLLSGAVYGQIQNYSVANGGASGLAGDDVWTRTPVPPTLNFPGAGLGYEVDAISARNIEPFSAFDFSVDIGSVGIAGAVVTEAAAFDQQADIYQSVIGSGINSLAYDGDGSTAPTLGLVEQPSLGADNVDGWENDAFVGNIFYSYDTTAPTPPPGPPILSGADVFVGPAGPAYDAGASPYVLAALLGLDLSGAGSDDIDALVVFDDGNGTWDGTDYVLFSLTRGSAAFGNGSAYTGANAADVLIASAAGGAGGVFATAASLGLNGATDNIDALDVIPEPSVLLLMLVAGGGMGVYRRLTPKG